MIKEKEYIVWCNNRKLGHGMSIIVYAISEQEAKIKGVKLLEQKFGEGFSALDVTLNEDEV